MKNRKKVVIVNGFDTYEQRVELLCNCFQKQGYDVQVIASDWMHFHKKKRIAAPQGYEFIAVKPYYKNLSLQRLRSHYDFAQKAMKRVEDFKPQILWVLAPPNSLVKFAALYKERHSRVKLVLDFMDMWPETMPMAHFKALPPFYIWSSLRDKYIKYADILVTECELYKKILCAGKEMPPAHTLYLACCGEGIFREMQPPEDKVVLGYLGSVNHIIDIPRIGEILQKIGQSTKLPVLLHVIGDGEKLDELKCVAEATGAEVKMHGKIYDNEKKTQILCECHYGLNIMKESVFVGLTMKSLDYFICGLPIINTIKGDTWEFVEKNEIGINYSSATIFTKEQFLACAQNRDRVRAFFEDYFSIDSFERQMTIIRKALEE